MADAVTVSYEKVAKSRRIPKGDQFPTKRYINFNSKMKDVVSVMVKEFEMKKTARRFARARTSTKGSLDVNALHRYKYDDQLFKQVTHLDDDQSHGVIMMIDYSSSMTSIIQKVIKQVLIMATFCKRVNIPFEVYGFTNPSYYDTNNERNRAISNSRQVLTSVSVEQAHVFKLIDSSMTKSTYEEAYRALFMQTMSRRWMGSSEQLSGTPLSKAILVMYHHIAAFRAKHNVQKMNFITLTDGDGDGLHISNGIDVSSNNSRNANNRVMEIFGQKIDINNGYLSNGAELLEGLRKMGVRTMNYHLVSAGAIVYEYSILKLSSAEQLAAVAKMKKDGCYIIDNNNGYDRQIFTALSRRGNDTTSSTKDEDEESDDIAEDFMLKSFNKKRDRLVAAKFAEIIS
jgi:hypothetical protein